MKNKFLPLISLTFASALCACGNDFTPKYENHLLTIETNEFCTIELNTYSAKKGDRINILVTEIQHGYFVDSITANNHIVSNYTFLMPDEDCFVKVSLGQEERPHKDKYQINLLENEFGYLISSCSEATEGTEIELDYYAVDRYILESYVVDGIQLDGNSFIMPSKDVEVELLLKDAIENDKYFLIDYSAGVISKSYWSFEYGLEGMYFTIDVMDRILSGANYGLSTGYSDNVECVISYKNDNERLEPFFTKKFLVSVDNVYYLNTVNYECNYDVNFTTSKEYFSSKVTLKSKENKEGYDGYKVNVFFSYELLGLTRSDAIGKLTVCPAMRNSNFYDDSDWVSYTKNGCNWSSSGTFPIVSKDGQLIPREKEV